jgi:phage tail sheath gpL-like
MTVTQTTAGAGEPSLAEVIAVLGDVQYTSIISPYTDATSLTALETEMESRWGPGRQIPGRLYAASNDTFSDVETLGSSRNSKQSVILGVPKSPSTPWEMAAILAGVEALQTNPAQPYTGLALPGLLAPARNDVLTREERNLLLYDGISTCVVDNAGNVSIERLITTYQTNAESVPDAAYLDLCSIQTLDALRYSLNTAFALKYPRYNLANDNDPVSPGQQILTPRTATAEIISIFDQWAAQGWVVNRAQFVGDIVCQRNAGNPNRLDVQLAPEIIALFLQFAAQVAFLL